MSAIRFRYQTLEFGDSTDIHVRSLRDNQQFSDDSRAAEDLGISSAMWPIFGVMWPVGRVLADLMHTHDVADKRILEVGCGLGLASLVLNARAADITATDIHPEVGKFLAENVRINNGRAIPFVRTGWADEQTDLGKFDLIVGSDVIYEPDHVDLLAGFIDQHACTPVEVLIVDPGRGHHARFSREMVRRGFDHSQSRVEVPEHRKAVTILNYRR